MSVNLQSKTLIENWVEERQVAHLEEGNRRKDGTLSSRLHRQGHKSTPCAGELCVLQAVECISSLGILTTNLSAPVEGASTVSETYRQPEGAQARCVGSRREALLQQLHAMVSREVEEELTPTPPTADYRSTTKKDFFQDFQPTELSPTTEHSLRGEQPASYWTDNIQQGITGVTHVCMPKAPFRRNAAFSTPVEQQMNPTNVDDGQ